MVARTGADSAGFVAGGTQTGRCALAKAGETGEASDCPRRTVRNPWTLAMQTVRSPSKLPSFPNSWIGALTHNAIASMLQPQDGFFDPRLPGSLDRPWRAVQTQR